MSTLTQASRQWASRPADQRFTSLTELNTFVQGVKDHAKTKVLPSKGLTVVPYEAIPGQSDPEHKGLAVLGPNGGPTHPTHWSFGQLAARVGAPAGYLRSLPSPLAADNLNYGLQTRDVEDVGVLLYKNGGPAELRAVNGPNYGRIWNSSITQALVDRFGDGLTGDFRVPGEFGQKVDVTKANTTLFASDRDMFVFLADEEHRVQVANRRDGQSGSLARGFFVWNSEVGAATFGVALFLFDYACCNRIVWGAEGYHEIRIRHTKSAETKLIETVIPAIELYSKSSMSGVETSIALAQKQKIDNVDKFLQNRFTKARVTAIKAAYEADEHRPIETLWDATTAVTAYARGIQYQDERVDMERQGGEILALGGGRLPTIVGDVLDGEFQIVG